MASLSDKCFRLATEVCFANFLIAPSLCRVEYNSLLPIIPSPFIFLCILIFLSVIPSTLLLLPVRLLSQAQWNATSLWSSLHYLWLYDVWLLDTKGASWGKVRPLCGRGLSTQDWTITRHPASINEKHPHPLQSPGSLHQVECLAHVTHNIAEGY